MKTDLCILGAGSAGLSLAAGAAQMGARVVLLEPGEMGGDCLNTGCVPSKALLHAASVAAAQRRGGPGVAGVTQQVDFGAVMDHVRASIANIAPHDSQTRFESLGVQVIRARGRFTGPDTVEAGGETIRARRFAIATGARPLVPDLPGLESYLTSETIWSLKALPEHLVIWGAGAMAAELAQAFRRLGSEVTLVTRSRLLRSEEPEAAQRLAGILTAEGVKILTATPESAGPGALYWPGGGVQGSHLLLALGRRPAMDIGLEAAGVAFTPEGITTNESLRTSNSRIFAMGDVAGRGQLTHLAGYHAGVVLRQAVLGLPARASAPIPRTVWTEPELAQVGDLAQPGDLVHSFDMAALDRGVTDQAQGLARIVIRKGRLVGVTLLGPGAGEQIGLWTLALTTKTRLSTLAGVVLPYPSLSEAGKRALGTYFSPRLFDSAIVKLIVKAVQRLVP